MKRRIEFLVAILSASVMLLAGCDKPEVSDNTEVDSLRRSIIASINKKIENIEGQIASLEDELASMRTSEKYKEDGLRILEEKISAASKRLSDIRNSVALLENSSSSFTEKAEEINSDLESLDSEIESIREMMQKLKADASDTDGGDVEKIIYVPKYDDRPDSLHYHLDGLNIIGEIILRFVAQPQESASSIAEDWETSLSAHAIYDGDEFDLAITDVSVNSAGLLLVSISADSFPRNFIEGVGCAGVKVMYGEEIISNSISVGAIVDESVVLTMLQRFDHDGDGQIVDNLKEMTSFDTRDYPELMPYFDLFFAVMPTLTCLICVRTDLMTLDLSNSPALITLDCDYNSSLTTLNVSNCPSLESLYCSGNALTTLDLSNCPTLTTLNCGGNALTTLDLSNCPSLESLYCGGNALTTLDLSNCPSLESLYCSGNALTTLDLSNSPALITLDCDYNSSLTTLDVSNCPALTWLSCYSNSSLTTLNVSNNYSLESLGVPCTVKLIVSTGLKSSIYQIGQYVSIDGVTGIVYKTSSPAIVSTDETSATWKDGVTWCTRKGSDWFLPNLEEMKVIYNNVLALNSTLSSIGATQFNSTYYWSSTEYNVGSAYCLDFSSDCSFYYDKDNSFMVRAVRAL